MGILNKIFNRSRYSDQDITNAMVNVSKLMSNYCKSDAKQLIADLTKYDSSQNSTTNINLDEMMSFIIFTNSLGLDTYEIRVQTKYFLFISLKTMWLLKQSKDFNNNLYNDIPMERFNDGKFSYVYRLDEYFSVLKNSKPKEMGIANVNKLALKNSYGDDNYADLERAKILSKPFSDLPNRYKNVDLLEYLF